MFGIKLGFFVGVVIFALSGWLIKAQYVYIGYPRYNATVVETGRYLDEDDEGAVVIFRC